MILCLRETYTAEIRRGGLALILAVVSTEVVERCASSERILS